MPSVIPFKCSSGFLRAPDFRWAPVLAREVWRAGRLSLWLLMSFGLTSCLSIPLPDEGPKAKNLQLPVVGDGRSEVREWMGVAPILDSGRYEVYEWNTDRGFVVAVLPMGVPAGAVVERRIFRMLVEYDELDQVHSIVLDDGNGSDPAEDPSAFERLARQRDGVVLDRVRRLNDIAGLEKVGFRHPEMTGCPSEMRLSNRGDLLMAVDTSNRGWLIDLTQDEIVGSLEGESAGFWDIRPPGALRMSLDQDVDRLVVTQFLEDTRVVSVGRGSVLGPPAPGYTPGFHDAVFMPDRDTLLGLETHEVVEMREDGTVVSRFPLAGLLSFSGLGVEVEKPPAIGNGHFAIKLEVPSMINPDVVMVFSMDGRGLALLDPRNDFARSSADFGYALSPDGQNLIVNKISHVEVWACRDLVRWLTDSGSTGTRPVPRRVWLLPYANTAESHRDGFGPIAVSADGRLLAVAGVCAVSVFELETGRPVAMTGPVPTGFPDYSRDATRGFGDSAMTVQELAVDPDGRLTLVLVDTRSAITIASWFLPP